MRLIIPVLIFMFFPIPLSAQEETQDLPEKTIIHNQAEAELLLGKHLFTNNLLCCQYVASYTNFGNAIIYQKNNVYYIHGGHEAYYRMKSKRFNGGFVRIEGVIISINSNSFTAKGKITSAVFTKSGLVTCPRTGNFKFSRKNHPAYWRLQEVKYPQHCLGDQNDEEYIDIFSRQEDH